jgi:division protein CdvB (Snf7/Vps24/ESCRT-III family)
MTKEGVAKNSAKIQSNQITGFLNKPDEGNQVEKLIDNTQSIISDKSLAESEPTKDSQHGDSYEQRKLLNSIMRQSTISLKVYQNSLEKASFHLKEQDRSLFETCMNALKQNNKEEATKLAAEIAEVRKHIKLIYKVRLATERVILRIETHICTVNTYSHIVPAVKALRSISNEIVQVLPDVSEDLESVCRMLLAVVPENPIESK